MIWMVGLPGHRPRLCVPTEDHAARMARSGEVFVGAAVAGDYVISGDGSTLFPAPSDTGAILAKLRADRDARLAQSDWTQLPDVPLSPDERAAWSLYRQALRDMPEQADFDPEAIGWPIRPDASA
ncbi:MAG: phage tail assembly chaperone [Sphingobium sp.]|nr:phage tail assembly chaperone [Sphingobium sp.]